MTDWNDKEQVLKVVSEDGYELENASDALRDDREIVLAAVQINGRALQHASKKLRAEPEIIAAAVKQDSSASKFLSVDYVSWSIRGKGEETVVKESIEPVNALVSSGSSTPPTTVFDVFKELSIYANQKGFETSPKYPLTLEFSHSNRYRRDGISSVEFYPKFALWRGIYLRIQFIKKGGDIFLRPTEHKFCDLKRFQGRLVSIVWIKKFLDFRSDKRNSRSGIYREDRIYSATGSDGLTEAIIDGEHGEPFTDDSDGAAWEEYMHGPDFE